MFKKFSKWMSLFMCASISICSPDITSMAETLPIINNKKINEFENSLLDEKSLEENESNSFIENDLDDSASAGSSLNEIASDASTSEDLSQEGNTDYIAADEKNANENTTEEIVTGEEIADENTTEEIATDEEITDENTANENTANEDTANEDTANEDTANENTTGEEITEEDTTEEDTTEENTTEEVISCDIEETIEYAIAAFYDLLQEKPLMALLYHTDSYQVQREAGTFDNTAATIESGHTLYITGIEILDGQIWYQVSFWLNGTEQTGYVESYYLAYSDEDWITWEKEYLTAIYPESTTYGITAYSSATGYTDYSDISAFPTIYQDSLRALKVQHPTWTFVPMNTGLDFNTAVANETGAKNLIQNTSSNAAKGWVGSPCPTESGWYYATKSAVSYYMNPCNFLTETYIFQFEQLTFNSTYHNVSAIQSFLNNTFMKGKLPDDSSNRTYAQAFYEIGKNRKLSPIHLASRVYQEQGSGNSALISGTYKGYEGYYNYFNVGVNGSSTEEKVIKGLTYAKQKGWNTRYKSLEGGAATIGNNYILKGQDTIYLEKFNVDVNSPHGLYNHQYMQNVQAPASESSSTKRMYSGAGSLNSGFVFKIPVYKNMPGEKAIKSISIDKTDLLLYRQDAITNNPNLPSGASSTASLYVTIDPADTTDDRTITWTSSNPKIVSVKAGKNTQEAVVTALDGGEATITAKSQNGKTAKCKVRVEVPLYGLKLANLNSETPETAATLYTGQNLTLTADYLPKDTTTDIQIVWSSSDPSVAGVVNGKVTALSEGSTTITATINEFTASYDIYVKGCSVTFMSSDYTQILNTVRADFGKTIPADSFPLMESTPDQLFIGWFTDKNGYGTRFDADTWVNAYNLVLYPYFEQQGKGFYVIPVGDQTYTGAAIKPQVHVYDSISYTDGSADLIELIQGQDYTVSYKNNKNVNTAAGKMPTITVKGKGNYSGTDSVSFNILPKPLTDSDITADNLCVAYNGKVQKSAPAVYRDGKKLVNKTDYTLTYPYIDSGAYKKAGVYPIVIKGTKNYTGTITVYETISQKTLLSKVSVAKIPNQTYRNELVNKSNNIGIVPDKLNITYKNQHLVQSTDGGKTGDYTVSYTNNMAVGTATATITAVEGSAYAGSKQITYKIVGQNISKAKVDGIIPKTYTGNESDVLQNNATLTLNNTILKESRDNGLTGDYLVSYTNTAKTGTASIIFKGINEYSGQLKKTYKITGYDISNGNNEPNTSITMTYSAEHEPSKQIPITSLSQITSPYMKGGTKPQIQLYHNGTALIAGRDYTVSYSNNTSVTASDTPVNKLPKLTIKGKGSFKGSLTSTWTITDGAMSNENDKLTITAKDITYKNKANNYKTTLTIIDANGKKLATGKDYDKNIIYTYAKDTQVSTANAAQITRKAGDIVDKGDIINANTVISATVRGIGAYAGSGNALLSTTYRIIAASITTAKLKVNAKVYQNGREVRLTPDDITLTLNGTKLVYGTDYIIDENSYTNNTKKGKATVILRGIGSNYGGQRKITFTIASKALVWWWR